MSNKESHKRGNSPVKDSPVFWRRTGWAILISGLAFMVFAVLQMPSNPAAVLVLVGMLPFVLIAGGLVTSKRMCERLAKPERKML